MTDAKLKIQYPTDYPIKVIGFNQPDFRETILEIVKKYDPNFKRQSVKLTLSKNARYASLAVVLWALSEQQIKDLFAALMKCPWVKLVL